MVDAIVESIQKGLSQRQNRGVAGQYADKDAEAAAAAAAPAAPVSIEDLPASIAIPDDLLGTDKPIVPVRKRVIRTGAAAKASVSTEDV